MNYDAHLARSLVVVEAGFTEDRSVQPRGRTGRARRGRGRPFSRVVASCALGLLLDGVPTLGSHAFGGHPHRMSTLSCVISSCAGLTGLSNERFPHSASHTVSSCWLR